MTNETNIIHFLLRTRCKYVLRLAHGTLGSEDGTNTEDVFGFLMLGVSIIGPIEVGALPLGIAGRALWLLKS